MHDEVMGATRRWLEAEVVGFDLCPYARGPLETGRVRFACAPGDLEARLVALAREVDRLRATDPRVLETTLLVLPDAPSDFDDFYEESGWAEELLGGDGALQIVTFHPGFRFEGAAPEDPGNATNRSPAPMWHLLRQSSVDRAFDADPEGVLAIPDRNRRRLAERQG